MVIEDNGGEANGGEHNGGARGAPTEPAAAQGAAPGPVTPVPAPGPERRSQDMTLKVWNFTYKGGVSGLLALLIVGGTMFVAVNSALKLTPNQLGSFQMPAFLSEITALVVGFYFGTKAG